MLSDEGARRVGNHFAVITITVAQVGIVLTPCYIPPILVRCGKRERKSQFIDADVLILL
jgi:hypothetical protein